MLLVGIINYGPKLWGTWIAYIYEISVLSRHSD